MTDPLAFRSGALCQYVDNPELFFPKTGKRMQAAEAKGICAGCEVRAQCLDYAVSSVEILSGIWGGTTETERRQLRAARQRSAA